MPSRFVRFDPETVKLLDKCMTRAQEVAVSLDSKTNLSDMRHRLAAALVEATGLGERDEERLVAFALSVLPAYRERLARGA
jgi:hypothetical protein